MCVFPFCHHIHTIIIIMKRKRKTNTNSMLNIRYMSLCTYVHGWEMERTPSMYTILGIKGIRKASPTLINNNSQLEAFPYKVFKPNLYLVVMHIDLKFTIDRTVSKFVYTFFLISFSLFHFFSIFKFLNKLETFFGSNQHWFYQMTHIPYTRISK